jgi:hypothetical protein
MVTHKKKIKKQNTRENALQNSRTDIGSAIGGDLKIIATGYSIAVTYYSILKNQLITE